MTDDIGSMEQEAAKLFRALSERLATQTHDPDSSCCICPVCRVIDSVKDLDVEQLASQATTVVTLVMEALKRDVSAPTTRAPNEEPTRSRVQHIDIQDESA